METLLLTERFSLVVLGLTLGAQLIQRSFLAHHIKTIWRIAAAGYLCISLYWSWYLYAAWGQGGGLSMYFLPPYNTWHYYVSKIAVDIFAPWVIALCAGVLFGYLAHYLNKRHDERFFEKEEIPILALGIFLTGYPGFFFYLPLIFGAAVLESLYFTLRNKGRAPLYYVWLPLAIFAIIIKNWLLPSPWVTFFNL